MTNEITVTVFVATSKIGKELLRFLSDSVTQTIAVTRDLAKIQVLPHVSWVQADMADMESLVETIKPGSTVLLLSGQSANFVEEQHNVVKAAINAKAKCLVKISSAVADKNSAFHIARVHGEVEEIIKDAGIPFIFLRPVGFMQNWLYGLAQTVKEQQKIFDATGEGKRAYIHCRDIANVAYNILLNPGQYINQAYLLTGGVALNYNEIAGIISDVTGHDVKFINLTFEQARAKMQEKNMPEFAINALLAYAKDQLEGKTAYVSPDVERILGKKPLTVKDFVTENILSFLPENAFN